MVRLIADCGLPLKIQTEWTETEYQDYDEFDYMRLTTVAGWRVRINGRIYPRGVEEYQKSNLDWSYRYTPRAGQTEEGRREAIRNALAEAGLRVKGYETQWKIAG
jgi:hypothetical protein